MSDSLVLERESPTAIALTEPVPEAFEFSAGNSNACRTGSVTE